MRALIIASLMLATACVPAMARCHGHETDGKWTLNVDSWSDSEMDEMENLNKQLKQIFPIKDSTANTAALVDQFECKAGLEHKEAIAGVVDAVKAMRDFDPDKIRRQLKDLGAY
jgi:hypothetical protein